MEKPPVAMQQYCLFSGKAAISMERQRDESCRVDQTKE